MYRGGLVEVVWREGGNHTSRPILPSPQGRRFNQGSTTMQWLGHCHGQSIAMNPNRDLEMREREGVVENLDEVDDNVDPLLLPSLFLPYPLTF